jgi:hypothetical protein
MKTYTCIEGRLYSQNTQSQITSSATDIHRQCPDCNGAGCGERGEPAIKVPGNAVLQAA